MKKKFLAAVVLGLAITAMPASVLAAQATSTPIPTEAVSEGDKTQGGGETATPMPEPTATVTPTPAPTEVPKEDETPQYQEGWNAVTAGGNTYWAYAEKKDDQLVWAKGLCTIAGKVYYFDENSCMQTGSCKVTASDGSTATYYFDTQGTNPGTDNLGAQVTGIAEDGKYYGPELAVNQCVEIKGVGTYYAGEDGTFVKNSVVTVGDKSLVFGGDGKQVTSEGWVSVDKKHYYIQNSVVSKGNHTKYQRENDIVAWLKVGTKWYLVDGTDGHRLSGWQTVDKSQYYFDPSDEDCMTTGSEKGHWKQIGDSWYAFYDWGGMRKGGWYLSDNEWYWLHDDGKMQSGGMIVYDNYKYFFASWGGMYKNKLIKYDNAYYYTLNWGGAAKQAWQTINGKWHYFKADSKMAADEWIKHDGCWYYLKSDGTMYASEWLKYDGEWYFFKNWGGMYQNEWAHYGGEWYYFKSWGGMYHDQWLNINGKEYYFRSWGGRYANGTYTIDGKSYTFDANGCLVKTGWTYIDGYRRYRNSDGSLSNDVTSIFNPSSKYITVDRIRGIVTIYGYNSETKSYDTPIKSMWCSVGNPISYTAAGTYNMGWQVTKKKMVGEGNSYVCWASYVSQIYGAVYFHGVASDTEDLSHISAAAFNALGTPQSHGCVRLAACDAKWIYQNTSRGTTIRVGDNLACPMSNPVRYQWKGGAYGSDPTWSPL